MRNDFKKYFFAAGLVVVLGFAAAPAVFAQAQPPSQADIVNLNFPCPAGLGQPCSQLTSSTSIGGFINTFYQTALAVSGLLALLMIVYGGIKYTVSAGNTGQQSDAKDIILSAVYGVVLLLASYLILNTINPKITNLQLPGNDMPNPPAPTTQQLTVTNTECIPLNSNTWDPQNTSTIAASTTYASLMDVKTWDGVQDRADTKDCSYRTTVTASTIGITSGAYYSSDTTIPAGSQLWQYPYFSDQNNPAGSAKCLVYAYQAPYASSTPTMVGLNSDLQLCYPHYQLIENVSSSILANCKPGAPCGCSTTRCSNISGKLNYKGPGIACRGGTCYLDNDLISVLEKAQAKMSGWQVSEAWPPTVRHDSTCHNLGTCADVVFVPQMTKTTLDCTKIKNLVSVFKDAGADVVLNEYPSKCGGQSYDTTTGWNIHVQINKIITGQNY